MSEKVSRVKSRAKNLTDGVKALKLEIKKTIEDKKREKEALLADISNLNEKLKMVKNGDEAADLSNRVAQLEADVKNADALLGAFRMTENKLNELWLYVKSFYDCGQYRFIVKKVSPKKLSEQVRDIDHIEELFATVYALVKEFNAKMQKLSRVNERYAALAKFNAEHSVLDETIATDAADGE